MTATFDTILTAIGLTLTLCSFFTVLGVFVLRVRRPDLPRPYRMWGYPVTPLIFLGVSLWMIVRSLTDNPKQSLLGLVTTAAGLLVYWLTAPRTDRTGGDLSRPAALSSPAAK